jgi:hypothetical protein
MKKILTALLFLGRLCSNQETISGIMITGKDLYHVPLALRSIQSFQEQTYPFKHLIIINDGEFTFGSAENITEIKLKTKHSLGALRNIGLNILPLNGLWVQWDDDDWHHPKFIQEQYDILEKEQVDAVCCLHQVQYAFQINSTWKIHCLIPGTIMCRKKEDIFYPEWIRGEDSLFLTEYQKKYKVIGWENPSYYYIRFIHEHNTWDENHFQLKKKTKNIWNLSTEEQNYLEKILEDYWLNMNLS